MLASLLKRTWSGFRRQRCPECMSRTHNAFCDVCGYELIQQTRDRQFQRRGV